MSDAAAAVAPHAAPAPAPGGLAARLTPRTRRTLALLAWGLATALVVLALRVLGWREALAAVRRADPLWVVAAAGCHATIVALWAWQTYVLLPRGGRPGGGPRDAPGFGAVFEAQALTATASNTVPAFLGQATGVALLAERTGVGAAAALSVFAQHNAVEGVAKVAMLLAAAQVAPLPPRMRAGVWAVAAGTAVLLAGLALAARWARRHPAAGTPGRTAALLRNAAASLDALREPRRVGLALLAALLMKGAEAGGWWAVERAFGVAPRPGSAVLALAATNLASAVPASPGNLGVYEGAAYTAYHGLLGVPRDTALALALVGHAAYLVPLVGIGWALLSARQLAGLRGRRPR